MRRQFLFFRDSRAIGGLSSVHHQKAKFRGLCLTFGVLRLQHKEVFSRAEGVCPFCGTQQRLGLSGKVFRLPRRVFCNNCQRELDLRTPAKTATVTP